MPSHLQKTIKEQAKKDRVCSVAERFINIESIEDDIMLARAHTLLTISEQMHLQRICGITSKFFHNKKVPSGIRSDLFQIFDLVAMHPKQGIIGIQCCGYDFSAHFKKITQQHADKALMWLSSGRGRTKIEIWSWRQIKKERGKPGRIWAPRIKRISYQDFKGHYRSDKDVVAA